MCVNRCSAFRQLCSTLPQFFPSPSRCSLSYSAVQINVVKRTYCEPGFSSRNLRPRLFGSQCTFALRAVMSLYTFHAQNNSSPGCLSFPPDFNLGFIKSSNIRKKSFDLTSYSTFGASTALAVKIFALLRVPSLSVTEWRKSAFESVGGSWGKIGMPLGQIAGGRRNE